MTSGQYSPVQPLCSVNKKLLFRGHVISLCSVNKKLLFRGHVISFQVELISRAVPSHSKVTRTLGLKLDFLKNNLTKAGSQANHGHTSYPSCKDFMDKIIFHHFKIYISLPMIKEI